MTAPVPLAYGLLNPATGKLVLTNVYAAQPTAVAAAERITGKWRTLVAVPLFGPEVAEMVQQLEGFRAAAEASQAAERALRMETVALRNELAALRGAAVAEAHAAGRPA